MDIKIYNCDYAPQDMESQLPICCEIIRKMKGSDRADYYLAKCEKIIKYKEKTIRYLVIAPRFKGQELREGLDVVALGVAYVTDETLLMDTEVDFGKCIYVAVCMAAT